MSDAVKPPLHGRDHRPIHFNGPDDPGGADPWCDWNDVALGTSGWGSGRFISVSATVPNLASGDLYQVDFSGGAVKTNDANTTGSLIDTVSSPFTGNNFSVNWSSDPYRVRITTEGVYLVYYFFTIHSFVDITPVTGYWAGDMTLFCTGSYPPGSFADGIASKIQWWLTTPIVSVRDQIINPGGTWTAAIQVQQSSGFTSGNAQAGIHIIRLGSLLS